jgi:hypothetical protein
MNQLDGPAGHQVFRFMNRPTNDLDWVDRPSPQRPVRRGLSECPKAHVWFAGGVVLKHQNARSFPELGVVLHQYRADWTPSSTSMASDTLARVNALVRRARFAFRITAVMSGRG